MQQLFDWRRCIKLHWQLLDDDIISFAKDEPLPDPFMSAAMPDANELLDPTPKLRKIVEERIEEVREQKTVIRKHMQEARNSVLKNGTFPKTYTFEKLWEDVSLVYVETMARNMGVLEECKERGLDKLLEVRSVKLCVAWHVSYLYQTIVKGEQITRSDSYDHQHAVSASVADIFVTQDRRFAKLMKYVPIEAFEIMSLQSFLNRLRYWQCFSFLKQYNGI